MGRTIAGLAVLLGALSPLACGGATPSLSGTRESGQSALMDDTLAGQNCKPENHTRPFIIEWDATDMARFEQFANNDVVVVRYHGCKLEVLDRCRDDAASGRLGAYKPVEWTSGSLESMDIATSAELAAELPLGVATLGGRVSAGEKFHMEYFVAGTRSATRSDVFVEDLQKLPGCEGATHFVYNYNLGAFALGSVQDFSTEANVSLYGFGADGAASKSSKADKKGGELAACKSDTLNEIQGCKAPIRLTLRSIKGGADPDMRTADTDESLNAAGKVGARVDESEAARGYRQSAEVKMNAGDGKGCLEDLDKHDKANPKHQSTDPKSGQIADWRGQCLMLSGKCKLGKEVSAKAIQAVRGDTVSLDKINQIVDVYAGQKCRGGDTDAKTRVMGALDLLSRSYGEKLDPKQCREAYNTVKKEGPKVKDPNSDQLRLRDPTGNLGVNGAMCMAMAGDCKQSFELLSDSPDPRWHKDNMVNMFDAVIGTSVPSCKGKAK